MIRTCFSGLSLRYKELQIKNCPSTADWIMLDLDVDILIAGGEGIQNPFVTLFREHIWTEREIIINLVGHADTRADKLQLAVALLEENGIALAVKEMGIHWGNFSLNALLDASMIKFDGQSLRVLTQDAAQTIVQWLIEAARRVGVRTIMTDINNCDQLEWARKIGVDQVQGPLFKQHVIRACNL